jgi:hypothetical protein
LAGAGERDGQGPDERQRDEALLLQWARGTPDPTPLLDKLRRRARIEPSGLAASALPYILGAKPLPGSCYLPPAWQTLAARLQALRATRAAIERYDAANRIAAAWEPAHQRRLRQALKRCWLTADLEPLAKREAADARAKSEAINRELEAIEFCGVLKSASPTRAELACPDFSPSLLLFATGLTSGAMLTGAACTFRVRLQHSTKTGKWLLQVYDARCTGGSPRVQGHACAVTDQLSAEDARQLREAFAAGAPAMIGFPSAARVAPSVLVEALGCHRHNVALLADVPKLEYELGRDAAHCVLVASRQLATTKAAVLRETAGALIMDAVRRQFPPEHGWTILIDEAGDLGDFKGQRPALPSTVVVVAVPPGVSLDTCPAGSHGMDLQAGTEALRSALLEEPRVRIFSFPYSDGVLAERLDKNVIAGIAHGQMWRHAISCVLEVIAALTEHATDASEVPVSIFVERVGPAGPTTRNFFDNQIAALVEANQHREGWRKLRLSSPRIVGKDEHPYSAYADAMGGVFRPFTDLDRQRNVQFAARKNVFTIPYEQATMEAVQAILQAGRDPEAGLKIILTLSESQVVACRPVLRSLASSCVARLNRRQFHEVYEQIQRTLSEHPDRYAAADLICAVTPENDELPEQLNPATRFLILLSRFAAANHRGDVALARALDAQLQDLAPTLSVPQPRYRYLALKGDALANALDVNAAFALLSNHIEAARQDLTRVPTAIEAGGFHFQLLSVTGQRERAAAEWPRLFEAQRTAADRQRLLVYRGHLLCDALRDGEPVASLLGDVLQQAVVEGYEDSLIEACAASSYLLALVLKSQALAPHLAGETLEQLLDSIHPPANHFAYPWPNIAFWATHAAAAFPQRQARFRDYLHRALATRAKAPILSLIHACLADQTRADEASAELANDQRCTAPGIDTEETRDALGATGRAWLAQHPQAPNKPLGMLEPLRFYYA